MTGSYERNWISLPTSGDDDVNYLSTLVSVYTLSVSLSFLQTLQIVSMMEKKNNPVVLFDPVSLQKRFTQQNFKKRGKIWKLKKFWQRRIYICHLSLENFGSQAFKTRILILNLILTWQVELLRDLISSLNFV